MSFMRMLLLAALVAGTGEAFTSAHRESPFITKNPKVDATDFWMFRSYETGREKFVMIIANHLPLQGSLRCKSEWDFRPHQC